MTLRTTRAWQRVLTASFVALGVLAGCGDDDATPPVCADADGDGQGAAPCGDDCDDSNPLIFVGNTEVCDGYDNDCDLVIDDGDFSADGAADLRDITGASSVTWGTGGSTSYSTASNTFVFSLDADGTLTPAREVSTTTNARCPAPPTPCTGGGGWRQLTSQETAAASCAGRGADWLATPECTADTECPQPACIRTPPVDDGGLAPIGRCAELDGGFYATQCRTAEDCAWPCASERCVPPARDDVQPRSGCTLADLATSPISSDGAFAVGIETGGCRDGRLRAGWLTAADAELLAFGPEARSNIWLGIDVGNFPSPSGYDTSCSGAGRASGMPGAAHPAVAALGPVDGPQALAVYLGASRDRDRCGDAVAVPVEGIGLLRETSSGVINTWLTGSNDGHPETFGDTNGGGAPAVAALADHGWVVGYPEATPSAGTPVALHFVGKVALPAPYSARTLDGGIWPAHQRRETAALSPGAPFYEIPAAGRADYVQIAVGAQRGRFYDVGVTWMEGCVDTSAETVWFSLVRVDPSMPTAATATDPVQLSTVAARGGFPAIVYAGAESPFVSPGWSRVDGGTPVAASERGGFVVAWAGAGLMNPRNSVNAVRVSEADGLPISAPMRLQPTGALTDAASVTLYATPSAPNGTVSFGYWDQETQIAGGRLLCPAM